MIANLWQRYSKVLRAVVPGLGGQLAGVLVLALLVTPARPLGLASAVALLAGLWWNGRRAVLDRFLPLRAALVAGLGLAWLGTGLDLVGILGWALLLLAVFADPLVRGLAEEPVQAIGLPGHRPPRRLRRPGPFFTATNALAAVLAGFVFWPLPTWWFTVTAGAALLVAAGEALREILFSRRRAEVRAVADRLAAHAPRFLVYFSGKPEALYQVRMWLPYLERTGFAHAILVRDPALLEVVAGITKAPVISAVRVEAIQRILPSGLGAVFYVNNEDANASGVRLAGPNHVHLGHGDSEKPPSYAATTAMFDRIFVAGQAGIDRFARHGVTIPREKFVIVGRPQLESLLRADAIDLPRHTVLYAPTWRGGLDDMQFGSLSIGLEIVRALLGLGARVIFRPHPYSARDAESRVFIQRIDAELAAAGTDHVQSTAAAALQITDCINTSTAAVTDVSSVASDYLFTRKPLAVTDMGVVSGDLTEDYPFLRGCYVLPQGEDPAEVLGQMLTGDPLASARDSVRTYYLGDHPAEAYAQVFVDACLAAVEQPCPRRG